MRYIVPNKSKGVNEMHLLLDVTCSYPDADLNCECVVLEISQTLYERLRKVAEGVKSARDALPDLHEVYC